MEKPSHKITPQEAADMAQVSYQVMMNWIRAGKLNDLVETKRIGFRGRRYFLDRRKFELFLKKEV